MAGTGTGTDTEDARFPVDGRARGRARAALALTIAANLALLIRGPGHPLELTFLFVLAGAAGLGWLLWEQRRRPLIGRRAVLAFSGGLLAVAVLAPPTESHDVWSYVMIGRTVAVHQQNPYEHPSSAYRTDPFRLRVDPVWRHTRSVYGPVFVVLAAGAVTVAGDSPWRSRVVFQALAALAVALSLLVIDRVTRGDPRALAFVGLNLLVIVTTVNNAHNDAYVGLAALGAVLLARRRPAVAGLILGLAALVKVVALLPAGVLALWLFRGGARRAGILLAGVAGTVTVAGYAAAGSASITVLSSARERMNRGSLWYPIREVLAHLQAGDEPTVSALRDARNSVGPRLSTLSTLAVIALAVLIATRTRRDAPVIVAAAVIAYTVLGAYILPWYMVWALPLLALVWKTRMAWLAVALAFVLELAYVTDERRSGVFKEPEIDTLLQRVQNDLRTVGVPLLALAAVIALVVWSVRRAGRVEADGGVTGASSQSPPRDKQERLDDRPPRKLRVAGGPIGEDDGDLSDGGTDRRGAVHGLDLEGVPVGSRAIELDGADEIGSVDAEPGGVVGDIATDGKPDIAIGPPRERPAVPGPAGLD